MTRAITGEWRTFRAPDDLAISGEFTTFAGSWPVIGLLFRDGSGHIWLGWADIGSSPFKVSWQDLGGGFARGPLVQTAGTDTVVIATRSGDEIYFALIGQPYEDSTRLQWVRLGATSRHDPVSVAWDGERIDIFALGIDGDIRQRYLVRHAGDWAASGGWTLVAEQVMEMPTAVSWGPQRLDLFGRSVDGSVVHKWWDNAIDRFDIFSVENTSKTTHKYWHPATGWLPEPLTQWEDIGGPLSTPPVVVSWGGYHLDLFGRGPEGHLRHFWWNPENGWEPRGGWEDMRGVLASAPTAFASGPDRLGVFAISVDDTLIYKYRDPGIFWRPSLTRWHECKFPGSASPVLSSLRAATTPGGLAVISVVEDSLLRAHVGIFSPLLRFHREHRMHTQR